MNTTTTLITNNDVIIPRERRFRVSILAYYLPIGLIIAGWCLIVQGILKWVHTEPRSAFMIIPGFLFLLLGAGIFKGYYNAYVFLDEKHLEYGNGKQTLRVATKDISNVELKEARYKSFIEVHSHGSKCIKIPAHYWKGGLLLTMLSSHKDANEKAR